ncbi:LacI family DNA-binding transcriptional regulator [Companilactobacillus nodensis]|uniref:Transcriptional regulator n=1 Tax=Companilactobacillus nodensis DSM 19682 = JCM 14932 = NBRC 107160 TaxID=1423775 RepID=A0A0R1K6M3_9LACO|nr:LacI family DNA-binding transcriptional regulator [Companilactobacillus nodensis]KRK79261.1 transcriptional regulator [Companilactobacillus nodensis DSM 19682 = JCM 14932 = NBRC 107160]
MNIHDIAKISGYSVSTVSRVINNHDYVSDKTRQDIQKVINHFDYVPNDVARDLSNGKTYNIGVVLPHTDHPYYTQLVEGIISAAFPAGYKIVMLPSKFEADLEMDYLNRLRRKAYDAIIFTSHVIPLEELLKYQQYGSIVICHNPGDLNIAAAYTRRENSYMEAFNWIKSQGSQKIGILLNRDYSVSATAQKTFKSYEKIFGSTPDERLLKTDITTYQDGYDAAKQFHQNEYEPDIYFTNGDDIAAGVRQFYLDNKLSVPKLIGQENQLSSKLLNIPTINHHFHEVGKLAFELAINNEIKQLSVESEFIFRNQKNIEN